MSDRMRDWTAAMRSGLYEQAWALAGETLRERNPATRDNPSLPYHLRWVWNGEALDGKDVLVRCYHGLGDTIQFARFLPLLAQRARSVTVEAQPRLIPLLKTLAANLRFHPFDPAHPLPPAQADVDITELDFTLRTAPDAVPVPYLTASRAVLPSGTVALCHGAGPWDPERSIEPALLDSICHAAPCITLNDDAAGLPVLNPQGCPMDMGATAALVAGADLVITVDTMIAHLAGALGRPTWLLLKADPDWRWDPSQARTAWYPSVRLYAQPSPGDWASVIERIGDDLAASNLLAVKR